MNTTEKTLFAIMLLTILIVGYRSYDRHRFDIPKDAPRIQVTEKNINKIQQELTTLSGK